MPSPPESPASSTHGSGTSAGTRFEDIDGEGLAREKKRGGDNASIFSNKSSAAKDIKGNVIVSVRVRPDTSGGDISKVAGEWMVDGRRSLISYKGGEGGDFRYDNVFSPHDHNSRVYDSAAKRLVRRVMEGYHGTGMYHFPLARPLFFFYCDALSCDALSSHMRERQLGGISPISVTPYTNQSSKINTAQYLLTV